VRGGSQVFSWGCGADAVCCMGASAGTGQQIVVLVRVRIVCVLAACIAWETREQCVRFL
jgi:hypothetical protein